MLTFFSRYFIVCLGDPAEEPVVEVMSMELVDDKKADEAVARVTKTIEQ